MNYRILQGHVLDRLRELPDESVDCSVTSPPYWGLRAYGTKPQVWGGDPDCDHAWEEHIQPAANGIIHDGGMSGDTLSGGSATRKPKKSGFCQCGAWRGEFGLEPTPELFIEHLVLIFREVRRVLKKTGTLWMNLGDSYNAYNGGAGPGRKLSKNQTEQRPNLPSGYGLKSKSLKPKDLVGIPWMAAFALRADGWYLRSDIIWSKPNPMPESVTDRPTKAHEYVFLLSKSERYFYDADAIREPSVYEGDYKTPDGWDTAPGAHGTIHRGGREKGTTDKQRGHGRRHAGFNDRWDAMPKVDQCNRGRNKRTVWTVATHPYPDAHFATYPEKLIEPCILAGCPQGGVVLDPFLGSGTTIAVALRLGRQGLGIELNPEYIALAEKRISCVTPGFQFAEAQ